VTVLVCDDTLTGSRTPLCRTLPSHYVDVEFKVLLPIGSQITKNELRTRIPGVPWDSIFQSGWFVRDGDGQLLRDLWKEHLARLAADSS
jgi:hypothetical protein